MRSIAAVEIANSLQQALTALLPNLNGFLVILVVDQSVTRVVKSILMRVLERLGVDPRLHASPVRDCLRVPV